MLLFCHRTFFPGVRPFPAKAKAPKRLNLMSYHKWTFASSCPMKYKFVFCKIDKNLPCNFVIQWWRQGRSEATEVRRTSKATAMLSTSTIQFWQTSNFSALSSTTDCLCVTRKNNKLTGSWLNLSDIGNCSNNQICHYDRVYFVLSQNSVDLTKLDSFQLSAGTLTGLNFWLIFFLSLWQFLVWNNNSSRIIATNLLLWMQHNLLFWQNSL